MKGENGYNRAKIEDLEKRDAERCGELRRIHDRIDKLWYGFLGLAVFTIALNPSLVTYAADALKIVASIRP